MRVNLNVSLTLSTTEDRGIIEDVLCRSVRYAMWEMAELKDPNDDGEFPRVLAIIKDVKVTAR